MNDKNVKAGVDSLKFMIEIHTYLGIKLTERTLIAHSLADKHMLLIKHVKSFFSMIAQVSRAIIRRNTVY